MTKVNKTKTRRQREEYTRQYDLLLSVRDDLKKVTRMKSQLSSLQYVEKITYQNRRIRNLERNLNICNNSE